MKFPILALTGVATLALAGVAAANTANTCKPITHKVVHRTLAAKSVHRNVHVLADEPGAPRAVAAAEPAARTIAVYERDYVEPPPPPPPVYVEEYGPPPPYPYYGPVYLGPRWGGYWGPHRGWRRW